MGIEVRRRVPRSPSELADVGARPEFASIESRVSTPRRGLTGARRGFSSPRKTSAWWALDNRPCARIAHSRVFAPRHIEPVAHHV
jgi:hypothetical protein